MFQKVHFFQPCYCFIKTQTQTPSAIGIDIAKDKFDAVHLPSNEHAVFENNKEGIKRFIHWARKRKPTTIVCEAIGGEQNEFVRQLIKANLPIHTANPARIKHYIASPGTKAKTDKSDARYIAQYALERQPEPTKNRGETHRKLKECLATRRQFVDEVKRLKCQFKHLTEAKLKAAMAVSRMKRKNVLTEFYAKLVAKGKPKMLALIALAHKILRIASALLKKKQVWNPNLTDTPT